MPIVHDTACPVCGSITTYSNNECDGCGWDR